MRKSGDVFPHETKGGSGLRYHPTRNDIKYSSVTTEQLVQKNLCITQAINGATGYKLKMFAAIAASVVSREEYDCNLKDIM
jgi:hypothetical protein